LEFKILVIYHKEKMLFLFNERYLNPSLRAKNLFAEQLPPCKTIDSSFPYAKTEGSLMTQSTLNKEQF